MDSLRPMFTTNLGVGGQLPSRQAARGTPTPTLAGASKESPISPGPSALQDGLTKLFQQAGIAPAARDMAMVLVREMMRWRLPLSAFNLARLITEAEVGAVAGDKGWLTSRLWLKTVDIPETAENVASILPWLTGSPAEDAPELCGQKSDNYRACLEKSAGKTGKEAVLPTLGRYGRDLINKARAIVPGQPNLYLFPLGDGGRFGCGYIFSSGPKKSGGLTMDNMLFVLHLRTMNLGKLWFRVSFTPAGLKLLVKTENSVVAALLRREMPALTADLVDSGWLCAEPEVLEGQVASVFDLVIPPAPPGIVPVDAFI